MAYTYDQFITAANGAGLLDKFTDDDLNVAKRNPEYGMSALKFQQDLLGAKTTEQKLLAQESLNQLRKSYGSVGTVTGDVTQSSAVPVAGSSYNNSGKTVYQQLLDEVTSPKSFEYDFQDDPAFQSMKKSYLREGDRAREDTMASFASATGGIPSSAAITAAQQAGDYYAAQLNDSIPTLQQNAYQRYLADIDLKQQALQVKQQEWENALQIYNKLGYATPEIAEILGLGVTAKTDAATPKYNVAPQPENPVTVDNATVAAIKASYPSGTVTDQDYWNMLLGIYTEDELNAAGLYYNPNSKTDAGKGSAGLAGRPGGDKITSIKWGE